ncbi:MAG: hypothetical protein ACXAEN_18120, partial [Candidatus Thorarchaeota archaeon]
GLLVLEEGSEKVLDMARREAQNLGIELRVQRKRKTVFPYVVYPRVLELFEYYFDIKERQGAIIPSMSLTGLQCLALGIKVFNAGRLHNSFHEESEATYVAERWIRKYEELL